MTKEFKKHPVKTEVTISHYRNPGSNIRMTMEEYLGFIEHQATELGLIEKKPKKNREIHKLPIDLEKLLEPREMSGTLTKVRIPKEFEESLKAAAEMAEGAIREIMEEEKREFEKDKTEKGE